MNYFKINNIILAIFVYSLNSIAFGMEKSEESLPQRIKKVHIIPSLKELVISCLSKADKAVIEKDKKPLSGDLKKLLESRTEHYFAPLREEFFKNVEKNDTENALKLFLEMSSNRKFYTFKRLIRILTLVSMPANRSKLTNLLNLLIIHEDNRALLPCFYHIILKKVTSRIRKLVPFQAQNDEAQQHEYHQTNKSLAELYQTCNNELINWEKTLSKISCPTILFSATIEKMASKLIFEFEENRFANFKEKFKELTFNDQENIVKYIFNSYLLNQKKFSTPLEIEPYLRNIVQLFKELKYDLLPALAYLLNIYPEITNYYYLFPAYLEYYYEEVDGTSILAPLPLSFSIIRILKKNVITQEIKTSCSYIWGAEISQWSNHLEKIYYIFNDSRIVFEIIEKTFITVFLANSQKLDILDTFLTCVNHFKSKRIFEIDRFINLKEILIGYAKEHLSKEIADAVIATIQLSFQFT